MKKELFCAILGAATLTTSAATLCENGKSDYAIWAGTNVAERAAALDLQEIFERSTGVKLEIISNEVGKAGKFIYVGYTPKAEAAFGQDDLVANEYAMTEKKGFLGLFGGGDIWLRGQNWDGTLLAVHTFCEDVLGYRCFMAFEGGERIVKWDAVKTDGKGFRKTQAFPFGRSPAENFKFDMGKFVPFAYRNGAFARPRWAATGTRYHGIIPVCYPKDDGHGFFCYMPCKRHHMDHYPWDERIDFFEQHPEWFSMNAEGKRTDRMQLCFSNPELRKAFTKRVLERCRRVGGEGLLTIGANDVPGPFCECPACKVLEKKYETPGGAYYDYLPEMCAAVAKDYPKILIQTLAYRKEQTENFPKGIAKFPDNFVCDFAPVSDTQASIIGGKGNEKTFENLKKWNAACKLTKYWYYTCTDEHPYGPVTRIAETLKRIHEAGTDYVGGCSPVPPGFGVLRDYLFLRLALDPYRDPWALVKEFCDFAFGAGSENIQTIVRDLDKLWFEPQPHVEIDARADTMPIYKAKDLLRWEKLLDEAEAKLEDDPYVRRNFGWIRYSIDFLVVTFWKDVRVEMKKGGDGQAKAMLDRLANRMMTTQLPQPYGCHLKPREACGCALHQKAWLAVLRARALNKPIPAPLDKLPPEQVICVPMCGGGNRVIDPAAACGEAMSNVYPANSVEFTTRKMDVCYYDYNLKRGIANFTVDLTGAKPGEYRLYCLGKAKIPIGAFLATWRGIHVSLSSFHPEGDPDRLFEIWMSLKMVGPGFGTETADGKSRIVCDRLFLVDKNGKKYRGEQ